MSQDFTQLKVWKESYTVCKTIYQITSKFPKEELFSLTNQLRRASVSIVANIAEGAGRKTSKDFSHFLSISQGSVNEVITMVMLSNDLLYIQAPISEKIIEQYQIVGRMLTNLQKSLNSGQNDKN